MADTPRVTGGDQPPKTFTLTLTTLVSIVVGAVFAGIIIGAFWVAMNDSVIQQRAGISHAQPIRNG